MADTVEDQIARRLAEQNLPKPSEAPDPNAPEKEPEAPEPGDLHNNLPLDNTLLKYELYDYFGVGIGARHSAEVQEQVSEILAWAKENAEGEDVGDLLQIIRRQEITLGTQYKGDRLYELYKFIRLSNQRKSIDKKMEALYGMAA